MTDNDIIKEATEAINNNLELFEKSKTRNQLRDN